MKDSGFITLHRKIKDSVIWTDSQAVHLWIHILLKANHSDNEFIQNGKLISVKRGQFVTGRLRLSEETGINGSKIQRLLKLFEELKMIEQQTNSKSRLISITNYDYYQSGEHQENSKRTANEHQMNTNNNDNNDNNTLSSSEDDSYVKPKVERIPYQQIVDLYHEKCPELMKVSKLNETRKRQIKARWLDKDFKSNSLEFWDWFFTTVNKSDFLCGRKTDFKADIQWLTKLDNFIKVMEGKYV